ncbi:acyltransferase domain-containing protein [Pseudenhygromyxa sp. WMMC2535]|uniref:type I polyketide synthase n=1 Tax=Pseudenhygromyxa sp. WMMC2535 TaxID=2712867 RepID=UPI00155334F3|nr:type I polyketide synthase [Pseudenhygromyxa sp. WMMC2535]NVB40740.1 acyltransferase domain-containing protein [Pseudenhygromyxa sp. WMMC2535]
MTAVAIVSMGAVLPKAPSVDAFGALVAAGEDATVEVPASRWVLPPAQAVRAGGPAADRVRSARAGLVDDAAWQVPLPGFDLLPHERAALDPSVQVLLAAAAQAWSGLKVRPRARTAVVLGNIVLPTEGANALSQWVVGRRLEARLGLRPTPEPPPSTWSRWVAGLPAGILARSLGLGGDAFTLDAACASSLFAIHIAVDKLRRGEADLVLTGGVSRPSALYTQMGFSQLGALSPSGRCAPFDAAGDGLVVGEGAAVLAVERLDDALKHGHEVLALIRGVGLSNDVDGRLLAPSSEGQLRAMHAAYRQAGWTPGDVELVECHATGTPVGDAVEFESLRQLRSGRSLDPAYLGASKANVGHLLTAAGAVATIRAVQAMGRGQIPPIANLRQPSERLARAGAGLELPTQALAWPQTGRARRAAISGFGFGGTNAHVLLEHPEGTPDAGRGRAQVQVQHPIGERRRAQPEPVAASARARDQPALAIVGLGAHVGPWTSVAALRERLFGEGEGEAEATLGRKRRFGELGPDAPPGWFIDALDIPLGEFRIPPAELVELLPQQLLLLEVAAQAMADLRPKADAPAPEGARCGVFAGVELDFGTTDYHLRWVVRARAPAWAEALGRASAGPDFDAWVDALCDALGPALSADRTMGGLASVGASRVARELRFGGPSFTLSSEESSGLSALQVAARSLQAGELDLALVGAVGLGADVRAWIGARAAGELGTPSEGALALVLMRLDDALARGERIYARVQGFGAASSSGALRPEPTAMAIAQSFARACADAGGARSPIGEHASSADGRFAAAQLQGERKVHAELAAHDDRGVEGKTLHLSAATRLGHAGAAAGLLSVVATALRLHHHVLDAPARAADLRAPAGAQRWIHDRLAGPRSAAVAALSSMGHVAHAILCEHPPHVRPWVPPIHEGLFVIPGEDRAALAAGLRRLAAVADDSHARPIHDLARGWFAERGDRLAGAALALSIVARSPAKLAALCRELAKELLAGGSLRPRGSGRVMFSERPLGRAGELAFVFPGSGSQFVGMGRRMLLDFPELAAAQDARYGHLRSQLQATLCWSSDARTMDEDARGLILAQVTLGTLGSDLVRRFGVEPQAVIGYSLGETAGLFALGAWREREAMLGRVAESPLFATELAGPALAAARHFGLPEGEAVDWRLGVVQADAASVDAALAKDAAEAGESRAYRLIVNTPQACVIGGEAAAVDRVVAALGADFHPLRGVTTVHCEVVREVEAAYRELHLLPTEAPEGVRFYSGAWGRSYALSSVSAADSVTAQAVEGLDYPAVIRRAWEDGVRLFVELGPGASCTRMIDACLRRDGGDEAQAFFARSLSSPTNNGRAALIRLLGWLATHRVPLDLRALHEPDPFARPLASATASDKPAVHLEVGRAPLGALPDAQAEAEARLRAGAGQGAAKASSLCAGPSPVLAATSHGVVAGQVAARGQQGMTPQAASPRQGDARSSAHSRSVDGRDVFNQATAPASSMSTQRTPHVAPAWLAPLSAAADAHAAYLASHSAFMQAATAMLAARGAAPTQARPGPAQPETAKPEMAQPETAQPETAQPAAWTNPEPPRALDRAACLRFAIGEIGEVLGPSFAHVDSHPTRVRLPAEPLMLVDRILEIEGEPHAMSHGRVVTEHDVRPGLWYLDAGRIPTCVAVEAGQADLFLSAFLGIDDHTKGRAVYRLLDATVTFHGRLPSVGATIHYDIRIERFFRQGETWLFRFGFDASVEGAPLMTMRDGCAGFFSAAELAAGKGVVDAVIQAPRSSSALADRPSFTPAMPRSLDAAQLEALRAGDLVAAFGEGFAGLPIARPRTLPGAPMNLVHRITRMDPSGGAFGLGVVEGEADIHPEDWFITCHFVDDPVMPGTLMYECCLHTLRVFLLALGWVGEDAEGASFEPRLGVRSRLECRGQVLGHTKVVTYVITMREFGADPEPWVICDASMLADGKRIVDIEDMSCQLRGVDVDTLRRRWAAREQPAPTAAAAPARVYDKASLEAYAYGKPSAAFGAPYAIFDGGARKIARLPGAPFQFMDRVPEVHGRPFVCEAGCSCVAEVERETWAWTLAANRQQDMAFAVLLEIGLQACGWLAAYAGSALTAEIDLKFRNLGGAATLHRPIRADDDKLIMRSTMTRVSRSGGMVIQHFDFGVYGTKGGPDGDPIYVGTTYFGFFTAQALGDQKGLREVSPHVLTAGERSRSRAPMVIPDRAPLPTPKWRMIERVDLWIDDAGAHGLGFLDGSITVDPSLWFFQAHFHEDPVWPGSLGLEAFLQLLKVYAIDRFELGPDARFSTMPVGHEHAWEYRGQVIPSADEVRVQVHICAVDEARRIVEAEGLLIVDGRPIYAMKRFALEAQ